MKIALLASIFLVFAVGCKKGPMAVVKDPGPAQLSAGAVLAESSDKTVSIAIPSGWKRGSESSFSMPSMSDLGSGMGSEQSTPSTEESANEAEEAAELEKRGILVWANDSSKPIPGEERTHFSVKKIDESMSLDEAAEAAKGNLINEGAIQKVELPIGPAARLEAKNTKKDGGELFTILYVVVNGNQVYNIRFTTQNGPTAVQSIEQEVINSLRIKPATP
jgi:hypothetical protein